LSEHLKSELTASQILARVLFSLTTGPWRLLSSSSLHRLEDALGSAAIEHVRPVGSGHTRSQSVILRGLESLGDVRVADRQRDVAWVRAVAEVCASPQPRKRSASNCFGPWQWRDTPQPLQTL
jgi:hypothetical protein